MASGKFGKERDGIVRTVPGFSNHQLVAFFVQ